MITGGTRGTGGPALARHVANEENNEVVEMGPSRGLISDDIHSQVMEVTELASVRGHKKPVYHCHLDWPREVEMTDGMRADFWSRFEREFGLENQPFASQIHIKNGRPHEHRQYSRLLENGKIATMSDDFARREKICRAFEHDHQMDMVKGRFNRRVASELRAEGRPDVADAMEEKGLLDGRAGQSDLSPQQRQQKERTGIDPRAVGVAALAAWRSSDSGESFQAALREQNLHLAQGQKTAVLVDASGSVHSLPRLLGAASKQEGGDRIKAGEVKARLEGIDLPPVEQVRADINNADRPAQGQQADHAPIIGLGGGGPDLEARQLQAAVATAEDAQDRMQQIASGLEQQVKAGVEQDQKVAAATKKKIKAAQEIADATARAIAENRRLQQAQAAKQERQERAVKPVPEQPRQQQPVRPRPIPPAGKYFQAEIAKSRNTVAAAVETARAGYNLRQIAHGLHAILHKKSEEDRQRIVKEVMKKTIEHFERLKAEKERQERLEHQQQPGTSRVSVPRLRR